LQRKKQKEEGDGNIVVVAFFFLLWSNATTQRSKEGDNNNVAIATLTWPSVGVKPNTWKSWGFGVLWDSRMFRARQQGAKHLALGCSWCHWKGLET
jgi:hypothetical protein